MSFEETIRAIIEETVRKVVREELNGAPMRVAGEFLTLAQAANEAGVSKGTVRNWIQRGRLPSFIEGRVRRVKLGDLRALLEGGREGAPVAENPALGSRAKTIVATLGGKR